jgi:hypothetical protein
MVLNADLILKVRVDCSMRPDAANQDYQAMVWPVLKVIKGNRAPFGSVRVLVYPGGSDAKVIQSLRALEGRNALVPDPSRWAGR